MTLGAIHWRRTVEPSSLRRIMRVASARYTRVPSRLTRIVALVAALGQLLVAVAAWADAADGALDARPHVEQDGTRLHHAHVESECALCAAQHIVSPPAQRSPGPPRIAAAPFAPVATVAAVPATHARSLYPPRAPPSAT